MSELDNLIEAVEAGKASTHQCSRSFPSLDYDGTITWRLTWDAYNGDLNAFTRLINDLLPGWRARLDIGRRNRCWLISPDNHKLDAYGMNPARAGLLATLRAYKEMQK